MTVWAATKAEEHFSALLDQAEAEGPQLVQRGEKNFILLTEQQLAQRTELATPDLPQETSSEEITSGKKLWDSLRCPPEDGVDTVLERPDWKLREIEF